MNHPSKKCKVSKERSRITHKICPHCSKELNLKTYRDHKRLFFNESSNIWFTTEVGSCSRDDKEAGDSSSFDEVHDDNNDDEDDYFSDFDSASRISATYSRVNTSNDHLKGTESNLLPFLL